MIDVRSKLLKKLRPTDTVEKCGTIQSSGRVLTSKNAAVDPERSFEIPATDMIADDVAGTWHTHPGDSANLSHLDYAGFLNWPTLTHYIVGTDGVKAYVVDNGLVLQA